MPATFVIATPLSDAIVLLTTRFPSDADSVNDPDAVPAPVGLTITLPHPLRSTIWLLENVRSGRLLVSVTLPSQRSRWICPPLFACTCTKNGVPGRYESGAVIVRLSTGALGANVPLFVPSYQTSMKLLLTTLPVPLNPSNACTTARLTPGCSGTPPVTVVLPPTGATVSSMLKSNDMSALVVLVVSCNSTAMRLSALCRVASAAALTGRSK